MNQFTFLKSKQVIKSPIPFVPCSQLHKKTNKQFFLNLSSDFDLTSSAKSKDKSLIDSYTSIRKQPRIPCREFRNSRCSNSLASRTQSSRLETKESTNKKQIQQIAEENLSNSVLTEKSISFSAFIVPTQENKSVETFSTICKKIHLFDKKKRPLTKKKVKTTEEIQLERVSLERENYRKLRITNDIMIDKIKNYTTVDLNRPSRITVKPFKLKVNETYRKRRNEKHCCACKAPLNKMKNGSESFKPFKRFIKVNTSSAKNSSGQ